MTTPLERPQDFQAFPLHDAIFKSVNVDWAARTCIAHISAFTEKSQPASPWEIVWEGVTNVALSHTDAWGPSFSINRASQNGNMFTLDMQSGDRVSVSAKSVYFRKA